VIRRDFLKTLKERVILFDGAIGTILQTSGLKPGGCPEELNLSNPDLIKDIHLSYKNAGSDVVSTNTFGGNRIKLKEYGLENKVYEINLNAVKIARESVGEDVCLAGDIGPTGKFIEPVGDLSFDEAIEVFSEQVNALKAGGVDCIIIETMMDIREMKAAILSAKWAHIPVLATMTFDETGRTVLGTPPEVFAIVAEAMGVDAIGANCSLGVEGIYRALESMSRVTHLPLISQPNAGIPIIEEGKALFPASPSEMASYVPKLASLGVRVIGGCCGTTPEHIKKMGEEVREINSRLEERPLPKRPAAITTRLASRTRCTIFGGDHPAIIVGERINPTGKKALSQEIREGKTSIIRMEARGQSEAGADLLDVNVGVPGIDEPKALRMAIFAVNENCSLPIVLDSSNPEALEEGLKAIDGKTIINSVSGEEKRLTTILPLAKRYGASVIGLTLDDEGIPPTAEGRFKVAEKIMKRALGYGMHKSDIVIDCLAMTIGADQQSAMETLKAIRMVKERLELATILGVSNISFGLPNRGSINASFLAMALEAGLDAAIINPYDNQVMDTYYASMVLTGDDQKAKRYIKRYGQEARGQGEKTKEESKTIAEKLKKAIIEGDGEGIVGLVEEALREGWNPLRISNEGLIPGLEEVGRLFGQNIYFLPQVMLSADTMKKAFERLKREFKGRKGPSLGKVLMATVEGDIHDIGKNIVSTLLENHGFEVIDLGKNVPSDRIVEEAIRHKVDVVGLSALMTTTVMEMENVLKRLKEKGVPVVTMVGGAVVTQDFANRIGANGYAKDALEAVEKVKGLVSKKG